MPAAFDACVKSGGRVRTKKMDGSKYMHICFKDGKSFAGEVKKKEHLIWHSDFIMEDLDVSLDEAMNHLTQDGGAGKSMKGKKIHGCLMKSESRNGRIYELDGMAMAGKLADLPMPISMNHTDDVTDNVGLITKLIPTGDGIDYEGLVFNTPKHPGAIEMMQNGLIRKISIEADNPIEEKRENKVIIKGFDLMGAGFVKYAGIPQASASIAEALEKTIEEEVEEMETENKLPDAEIKSLLEAKKELDTFKLAEAEKKKQAEEAKRNEIVEQLATLQTEIKALKESKKSGIITGQNQESSYQIKEKLEKGMPEKTFVFESVSENGRSFKQFYSAHPEEFY